MPLRKKQVRRTVAALLLVFVLGPLIALGAYGWWVRRGGYEAAIAAELETRLRCHATVHKARPTGFGTATADHVELTWATGGGRLNLHFTDVAAEQNIDGRWRIKAASAALTLEGPDPGRTLAAVNQRLVQVERRHPIAHMAAERMFVSLETPLTKILVRGRAETRVEPSGRILVRFWLRTDRDKPLQEKHQVSLAFNPTSQTGVCQGLWADLEGLPARCVFLKTPEPGRSEQIASGTIDLNVNWYWYGTMARKGTVDLKGRGLSLEEWTAAMPGGKITGAADVEVHYAEVRHGPGQLDVSLACEGGGQISGQTLTWLEDHLAGVRGVGHLLRHRIGFSRMNVRCRVTGVNGRFEGESETDGTIPLVTTRLFGTEVPLLWSSPEPLEAADLRSFLRQATGVGSPSGRGHPTGEDAGGR